VKWWEPGANTRCERKTLVDFESPAKVSSARWRTFRRSKDPRRTSPSLVSIDRGVQGAKAAAGQFPQEEKTMKKASLLFAIVLGSSSAAFANVKTETIKVSGWKCEKCPAKTEAKLKEVKGVESAAVDREKSQVVVKYDDSKAKHADLEKAVADSGFSVSK
jgi:copper chaperone CopZ